MNKREEHSQQTSAVVVPLRPHVPRFVPVEPQPVPKGDSLDSAALRVFARLDIAERSLRRTHLAEKFCEGPAWNILTAVFAARLGGRTISTGEACLASGAPETTALRYIAMLEYKRAIMRFRDPLDQRRFNIALSDETRDALAAYFAAVRKLRAATDV